MYDREKCYKCFRYLKECVPPHDIDPSGCNSFITQEEGLVKSL